ncbi:MAG TPA: hypothetical protein VF841_21285 [Anaeromyxobacter sp.]
MRAVVAAIALFGFGVTSAHADEYAVHRSASPAGVVLRDTVAGGLVGTAVGGGIILYQMGINNAKNYDWGRTLAWGAVIGLGVGLVWGVVDATTGPSYAMTNELHAHDGQSMSLDVRSQDQSGAELFPLMMHRF